MAGGKMFLASRARRFPKRKGPKLSMRQKADVKRLIANKQELKNLDTSDIYKSVSTGGDTIDLSEVAREDGSQFGRDGNEITIKSLDLRFSLHPTGTSAFGATGATGPISSASARVLLVQWNEEQVPSSNEIDPAEVLEDASTDVAAVHSAYNMENIRARKLKILYDKLINLSLYGYGQKIFHRKVLSGFRARVRYDDTVDDGTQGTSKIFLIVVSEDIGVQYTYYHRLNYTDS